jgi:hypothetical protein
VETGADKAPRTDAERLEGHATLHLRAWKTPGGELTLSPMASDPKTGATALPKPAVFATTHWSVALRLAAAIPPRRPPRSRSSVARTGIRFMRSCVGEVL